MLKPWLALTLCLAVFFPAMAPAGIAHGASCKVAGGQSGALKYSGQVGAISAKVCGNEIWKLLPKPKVPIKKKPAKQPAKKVTWKNEFSVSPKTPGIQLSKQGPLQIGEPIDLTALAKNHTKNRLLLWYPAQVKFNPVNFFWNFADGADSSSALVAHSWAKVGKYLVTLAVGYSVNYRIIGKSGWISLPGLITVNASPLSVQVGEMVAKKPRVVLVHWNCIQRIQAVGC
jgi:hypothetical protein